MGDQVSIEVIAPLNADLEGQEVLVDAPLEETLGPAEFEPFGLSGRHQATLMWAWDTRDLEPGEHPVTFSLGVDGPTWTQTVSLQPREALSSLEEQARWESVESQCCQIHYLSGTSAERDLRYLLSSVDEQARLAEMKLRTSFEEPVSVVILSRVLGHGGFVRGDLAVSYLDRRYSGGNFEMILRHELIHLLDSQLGGQLRPTMLAEGLAVYLSGGHFKPEPLMPRAAVLLDMDWYLPLAPLARDFYPSQHEIGYLEAGALVEFMVARWGWDDFSDFYRDIHPDPEVGDQVEAINAALNRHFGVTFTRLEALYLDALRAQEVDARLRQDVRTTVNFYDTVRRYQRALDPSAYYLSAWLPDTQEMRERDIVADVLRHPTQPRNVALEALLVAADERLRDGRYPEADGFIQAVNAALDELPPEETILSPSAVFAPAGVR